MISPIQPISFPPSTALLPGYDVGPFKWGWMGAKHLADLQSVQVGNTQYDFASICVEAMNRLGQVLTDQTLYEAVADRIESKLINGRPITPQGFQGKDVDRLLKQLKLRHHHYQIGSTGGDIWGVARLREPWLGLNAASITHTVVGRFGDDPGRVADVAAGVIIHEMMHCDGFSHSLRPGDYIYECSLPEVVQDAYLSLRDQSGKYEPFGLTDRCGC